MSELIERTCPHCGKCFSVPAELTEFSCLYCGRPVVLKPEPEFSDALAQSVAERLPAAILDYPENYKRMGKADYAAAFAEYEAAQGQLLRELDACVSAQPEAGVTPYVTALLDGVEAALRADPRFGKKSSRTMLLYAHKATLALFFTALAGRMRLSCAPALCEELKTDWLRRFPGEVWTPGNYDEIITGYRASKWCFITTAVCRAEGKPDDCAELQTLRSFRDGWLRRSPGGEALIETYYAVAPGLVAAIELCDAPEKRYAEIRARWLDPCLRFLAGGQLTSCRDTYISMVETLRRRYAQ